MTNRAEAVIDLSAIRANVALLKGKAGVDLLAVVKADAYGHGLIPVAKAALEGGATWLGVAFLKKRSHFASGNNCTDIGMACATRF
jgi:alanine racemase